MFFFIVDIFFFFGLVIFLRKGGKIIFGWYIYDIYIKKVYVILEFFDF